MINSLSPAFFFFLQTSITHPWPNLLHQIGCSRDSGKSCSYYTISKMWQEQPMTCTCGL